MSKCAEYGDLDHLPGPERALAQAVRNICSCIGDQQCSLRALAKEVSISRNVLSGLINGKHKRPSWMYLDLLFDRAAHGPRRAGLQVTLDVLKELHRVVVSAADIPSVCATCPMKGHGATQQNDLADDIEPADRAWPGVGQDTVLPVIPQQGDRQRSGTEEWAGMGDLVVRLLAGEYADAAGILRHVGFAATASDAAVAIVGCRRRGLDDAAAAIIAYAAKRVEGDILKIIYALLKDGHTEDACELIELSFAE